MSRRLTPFERDFRNLHGRPLPRYRVRDGVVSRADPLAGVPWFGRVGLLAVIGLAIIALGAALAALLGGFGLYVWSWF